MANYACMAIGINRYQNFQPLSYAQADAQALQQFLQAETTSPQNCLLLSDASAWIGNDSTYPTRKNILHWLHNAPTHPEHRVDFSPKAVTWFFFSGYGVHCEGQDYLMPVDGDPSDIPSTGISVKDVFQALQKQGAQNLFALLDMSRSPGAVTGEAVGQQTLDLAKKMGVVLLLSTQVGEFSYEAGALGNGMFTAAILEALRYYRSELTLVELEQYLYNRLPEFSEHHWRPSQTPVLFVPSKEGYHQAILPGTKTALLGWCPVPAASSAPAKKSLPSRPAESPKPAPGKSRVAKDSENNTPPDSSPAKTPPSVKLPPNLAPPPRAESQPQRQQRSSASTSAYQWDTLGWSQGLFWGGSLALALAIGFWVFFGNQSGEQPEVQEGETATSDFSKQLANSALAQARLNLQDTNASALYAAIEAAQAVPANDPLYAEAQANIERWSRTIFDVALGRAAADNYQGAIAAARLIPNDQTQLYDQVLPSIESWKVKARQKQDNQALFAAAQELVRPGQASSYNQAAAILEQIPPDQPLYEQAREQIEAWSQQIYLLANNRAAEGNYSQAVAAAQLVPENSQAYGAAQSAIAQWQRNF